MPVDWPTILGALWAGFVVYRLETIRASITSLRDRLRYVENEVNGKHK